jgi:hypothetical protein
MSKIPKCLFVALFVTPSVTRSIGYSRNYLNTSLVGHRPRQLLEKAVFRGRVYAAPFEPGGN